MGENEIIDCGIRQNQPQKQPGSRLAPPQRPSQPPESQHRRREKYGILERRQRWNFRRPRQPAPVVDEALDADPDKELVASATKLQDFLLSLRNARNLAH